jgi:hypothetical protein
LTGPYLLHKGEEVTPVGVRHGDMAVNYTIHVHGDYDRSADQKMKRTLENNTRGILAKLKKELGLPHQGGSV